MTQFKSWQCVDNVFTGEINLLDCLPYQAVRVPIPSDKLPEGRVWTWVSLHNADSHKWGLEGSWKGEADNRGKTLYTGDGKAYTYSGPYKGFGEVPAWLTTEVRPSPHHILEASKWTLTTEAQSKIDTEVRTKGQAQIEAQHLGYLMSIQAKQIERTIKLQQANDWTAGGEAPALEAFAKATGQDIADVVAGVIAKAEYLPTGVMELAALKDCKYDLEDKSGDVLTTFISSVLSRMAAIAVKLV